MNFIALYLKVLSVGCGAVLTASYIHADNVILSVLWAVFTTINVLDLIVHGK